MIKHRLDEIFNKNKLTKKQYIMISLYSFMLISCFLLFQQGDLFHTSTSSYAYLEGHFFDFYDYNKSIVGGNDYYALMYIIFAIWNIPLKLLGLTHDVSQGILLTPIELLWTKLLLVIFFFGTTYILFKITKLISNGNFVSSRKIAMMFATSPIAIFAVFIFGQYDIIGLFFTMIGFYYYLKYDKIKFAIFFSLAISLKFFPIVLFIPLILLDNKKLKDIIKLFLIGMAGTILQILMYLNNDAFKEKFFSLASGKVSGLYTLNISPLNNAPYLILGFCIICIYAYITSFKNTDIRNKKSIFLCLGTYALLFSTVIWHPQWLIILMPFFALAYYYIKEKDKMCLFDIVGMLAFIYITVNYFPANVDVTMVRSSILRNLFGYIPLIGKDILIGKFVPIFQGVFFVYLFSPILVYWFEERNLEQKQDDFKISNGYFYSRLYIGSAIFVSLSLFCIFVPEFIAKKIDIHAYSQQGLSIENSEQIVGDINQNICVVQSIIAEKDFLREVDIKLATYARENNGDVTFALYNESGEVVAEQQEIASGIMDNTFYHFQFEPIQESLGKRYYIKISHNGNVENSITAYGTMEDIYTDGECYINEELFAGDLNIKLYYNLEK